MSLKNFDTGRETVKYGDERELKLWLYRVVPETAGYSLEAAARILEQTGQFDLEVRPATDDDLLGSNVMPEDPFDPDLQADPWVREHDLHDEDDDATS